MSTTPDPTPIDPTGAAVSAKLPRSLLRFTLSVLIFASIVAGGVGAYLYFGVWNAVARVNFPSSLRHGLVAPEKLAERFTDADGNLVADPPTDPEVVSQVSSERFPP